MRDDARSHLRNERWLHARLHGGDADRAAARSLASRVDIGRAYVVKAQLTKAVDGAALAAARALNSGNPQAAATRIFRANFPTGYLGTLPGDPTDGEPAFFTSAVDRGDRRQYRDRHGDGGPADDVHAAGELHDGDGRRHR